MRQERLNMKNLQIAELAWRLEGVIAARKYLDANPIASQLLSKESAEFQVYLASRYLYSHFADIKLWQGVDPEDEREVREVLEAAYESVTVSETTKKLCLVQLDCFKKFITRHAVV